MYASPNIILRVILLSIRQKFEDIDLISVSVLQKADYPSSESTERIIVKRTLLPPLGEVYSKLKSAYGNYMLTYEDELLNFLEE